MGVASITSNRKVESLLKLIAQRPINAIDLALSSVPTLWASAIPGSDRGCTHAVYNAYSFSHRQQRVVPAAADSCNGSSVMEAYKEAPCTTAKCLGMMPRHSFLREPISAALASSFVISERHDDSDDLSQIVFVRQEHLKA